MPTSKFKSIGMAETYFLKIFKFALTMLFYSYFSLGYSKMWSLYGEKLHSLPSYVILHVFNLLFFIM